MMDWPVISALAALAGFGLAFATFWLTFGAQIATAKEKAESAERDAKEAQEKVTLLSTGFSLYREQVAREYIHREVMGEVENRLTQAIDRLGERLDRFVEAALRKMGSS